MSKIVNQYCFHLLLLHPSKATETLFPLHFQNRNIWTTCHQINETLCFSSSCPFLLPSVHKVEPTGLSDYFCTTMAVSGLHVPIWKISMHLKHRTYSSVSHLNHKHSKQYITTVTSHISKENPFLKKSWLTTC